METRRYLGVAILPCCWEQSKREGYRWYIQAHHHTGIPYEETLCPRFSSLDQAREYILGEKAKKSEL